MLLVAAMGLPGAAMQKTRASKQKRHGVLVRLAHFPTLPVSWPRPPTVSTPGVRSSSGTISQTSSAPHSVPLHHKSHQSDLELVAISADWSPPTRRRLPHFSLHIRPSSHKRALIMAAPANRRLKATINEEGTCWDENQRITTGIKILGRSAGLTLFTQNARGSRATVARCGIVWLHWFVLFLQRRKFQPPLLYRHIIQPPQFQLETLLLVRRSLGNAEVHLPEAFERSRVVVIETPFRSAGKGTKTD